MVLAEFCAKYFHLGDAFTGISAVYAEAGTSIPGGSRYCKFRRQVLRRSEGSRCAQLVVLRAGGS